MLQIGHEVDPAIRRRRRQGETIRKVRTLRSMSMVELADACGVTQGAVSQWETGRFTPRADMQVRIARALDVPWSTIFALDAEAVA
jgi:transcriptional regulator with XRE-family HTH domain